MIILSKKYIGDTLKKVDCYSYNKTSHENKKCDLASLGLKKAEIRKMGTCGLNSSTSNFVNERIQ